VESPIPPSFLIIHPGALGDVLQAVPAVRLLRAGAPAARLVFAGQPRLGRLLVALGAVDEARGFDGLGLEALFTDAPVPAALAAFLRGFARVVSWFGAREPGYRARLGALARDLLIARPVPEGDTPVWRHLVATLGDTAPVDAAATAPLTVAAPAGDRRALLVHAGSGGAWKRWPPERFAQVIEAAVRATGVPVLLHQGPTDRDAVDALAARLSVPVERLAEPDLPALAAALAGARAYLGGDSGVSHLAAAVGAPSVILFPPAHLPRWTPWSPTARAIAASGGPDEVRLVTRALDDALTAASR
jgi:ADP-heptose:LPS heptosyltransferase